MKIKTRVSQFIQQLGQLAETMPDSRKGGPNQLYSMKDALLGAFSLFHMQSESFLAHQRLLAKRKGRSNLESVFKMKTIPTDTHIKNLLDGVPASQLGDAYKWLWQQLVKEELLSGYRTLGGRLLVGIDGIQFFSSAKIKCEQCSQQEHDGHIRYTHRALTALVVHPEQPFVLPVEPEFLLPQDGADKQDSEIAAAKRWLSKHEAWLQGEKGVILGDDLFSHQPFCQAVLAKQLDFILVCKPTSHETLYAWVEAIDRGGRIPEKSRRVWNGRHGEIWRYRYLNDVPLRAGDDALRVNWCELTVTHQDTDERLYHNSFVTSIPLDDEIVMPVTHAGRARWKHENEGHNVLTTRGYNIKHNFGHGQETLTTLLFSLNMLAFFLHTFLELADWHYQQIREALGARRVFFENSRSLMNWHIFESWEALIAFMFEGLELGSSP
ncbi:MAG TPA: ISNCY family transposase [Anaerolineae bacterium]|nr:ISNCY family transposase [Anaerolineae bacterium]